MNGQMKSFKQKRILAEDFVKKSNPYEKKKPLNFDLRAYASYVKMNNLKPSDITPQIMKKFER